MTDKTPARSASDGRMRVRTWTFPRWRWGLVYWLAVLAICVGAWPASAHDVAQDSSGLIAPREYLALFDIDAQAFRVFVDGQPLDEAQREQMLAILFRLRRYPPAMVDRFCRPAAAMAAMAADPGEARAEIYSLAGRVTRVERQALGADDRQRLEFDAYYRCAFATDSGEQVVVYALAVPAAWKLDAPIAERAAARAMFLKLLPSATEGDESVSPTTRPQLLFVTDRVAWYPDTLLGELGMDVGLLDGVSDRTGLNERECFYQLLAAARRAREGVLRGAAREQLAEREDAWREASDDKALDREQRAAARRALERAKEGTSDIVPLFNEPASARGDLVTLRGDALRALEIRVEDPDIVRRFGIRRYYEVEIVTRDSENNPIVCCVAQLPEGMPLGDNIREAVRVTGFFLKSWAYSVRRGAGEPGRRQLAPLVIAGTLTWIPEPAPGGPNTAMAAVLVVAIAAAAVVIWYVRRGDRRALEAAEKARSQLPQRISLEPPVDGDA